MRDRRFKRAAGGRMWTLRFLPPAKIKRSYADDHGRTSNSTFWGLTRYSTREVLISNTLSMRKMVSTIIHEAIHVEAPNLDHKTVKNIEYTAMKLLDSIQ
ncbi:MAG: hypothetical protein ACYDCC_04900 [Actinomycetota bacterium]